MAAAQCIEHIPVSFLRRSLGGTLVMTHALTQLLQLRRQVHQLYVG